MLLLRRRGTATRHSRLWASSWSTHRYVHLDIGRTEPLSAANIPDVYGQLATDPSRYLEADALQTAHDARNTLQAAVNTTHGASTYNEVLSRLDATSQLLDRLVIRRAFWEYEDYAPADYTPAAAQASFFDNYKWVTELSHQFKDYAEQWYPEQLHTHLRYTDYMALMRYFRYAQSNGRTLSMVLPRYAKIKPMFGVPVPTRALLEPFLLYRDWLFYFAKPLGIRTALVANATCGIAAFQTVEKVRRVLATDPSVRAVESMKADKKIFEKNPKRFGTVSVAVAELAPERSSVKFDLITLSVGCPVADLDSGLVDYKYAPGFTGLRGQLEAFFEDVAQHLAPGGVIAILFSNLHSLAEPDQPHPIEHELRANRRFVLLDYYDSKITAKNVFGADQTKGVSWTGAHKLKAELWVLHRLEDLPSFGWIHGVPGSQVPEHVAQFWSTKSASIQRKRVQAMRQRVEDQGGDWGEYQDRLLAALETAPGEEDEVAMALRAKLDPTYKQELALQCKQTIEASERKHREWLQQVAAMEESPRSTYEAQYGFQQTASQASPEHNDHHRTMVDATTRKKKKRRVAGGLTKRTRRPSTVLEMSS